MVVHGTVVSMPPQKRSAGPCRLRWFDAPQRAAIVVTLASPPQQLDQFPLQVGPWTGTDVPLQSAVLDMLGKGEPPDPERLKKPLLGPINVEWGIYLLAIPGVEGRGRAQTDDEMLADTC